MDQLKPPTSIIPPWAASLLGGSSSAATSPVGSTSRAQLATNGPQSFKTGVAGVLTPTGRQSVSAEAKEANEDSGDSDQVDTDWESEEPERVGADEESEESDALESDGESEESDVVGADPAAPASKPKASSHINPAPAQIASDVPLPRNGSAPPQRLSLPALRVKSEPTAVKATAAGDQKGKSSSFAASSEMKTLQSTWEQSATPKPSSQALKRSSPVSSGLDQKRPQGTNLGDRTKDWAFKQVSSDEYNANNKRPLQHVDSFTSPKRRHVANPSQSTSRHDDSSLQEQPRPTSSRGPQQITEQDLVKTIQKNDLGFVRTTPAFAGSRDTFDATGSKPKADSVRPTLIPISRVSCPPLSSSEDEYEEEEAEDEAEVETEDEDDFDGQELPEGAGPNDTDSDDPVEDIENTRLSTQTAPQANDGRSIKSVTALYTSLDGRPYNMFRDSQGAYRSACGGVLPTNYETWDDPTYPFICPVRDCRRILPRLLSLGSHMGAKHCSATFNDNVDGTLSFVATYKNAVGSSPPIIVSATPLGADAPELAEPAPSGYVKKNVEEKRKMMHIEASAHSSELSPRRRSNRADLGVVKTVNQAAGAYGSIPEPLISHAPGYPRNDELYTYLAQHLPPGVPIKEKKKRVLELLMLPRRRNLPKGWKPPGDQRNWNPPAVSSLLMYLTGDIVEGEGCSDCQIPGSPWKQCVIAPVDANMSKSAGKGACAACWFKSNCMKRRNTCSFLDGKPVVERHHRRSQLQNTYREPTEEDVDFWPELDENPAQTVPNNGDQQSMTDVTAASQRPVRASASQNGVGQSGAIIQRGTVMSADILEMEDWEVAPGRIRDDGDLAPENIAFSNSFLTSNKAVPISNDVSFNIIALNAGGSTQLEANTDKLRVCSLATGKVRVKMDDREFAIGPNGMFKVRAGARCEVLNRLYVDAILHVSTITES